MRARPSSSDIDTTASGRFPANLLEKHRIVAWAFTALCVPKVTSLGRSFGARAVKPEIVVIEGHGDKGVSFREVGCCGIIAQLLESPCHGSVRMRFWAPLGTGRAALPAFYAFSFSHTGWTIATFFTPACRWSTGRHQVFLV